MTPDEHRAIHAKLHTSLDTLVADWLAHHPHEMLAKYSIIELMKWSYSQTLQPSILPDEHTRQSPA